ncbi:Cyclic di-GMP phosphodiesterase response regulator RpfG [Thalassocella blandensis]|nr:Cyclic di-GMP phosphodiesterase response regulator RpfG [Thalassocella blandensis]
MNAANESLRLELDEEIKAELFDAFSDLYYEIEDTLIELKQSDSQDALNSLFRHIHTIKGNAAIVQLLPIVDYTHHMEEVMACLRARKFHMSQALSDIIHAGIDRLRDLHLRELYGHTFDQLHEKELRQFFCTLAHAESRQVDALCQDMLAAISAGLDSNTPDASSDPNAPLATPAAAGEKPSRPTDTHKQSFDLAFFKELATKIDHQCQCWQGRNEVIHDWTLKVNAQRQHQVNPTQLSAAAYMHDLGMNFIPKAMLENIAALSDDESQLIKQHPEVGYNFLIRMPGWDEAATIVLEHHEQVDGLGYPFGHCGSSLHDGAKILAIVEAFFSIVNCRAAPAHRKTIVRAVSEINSRVGTEFDEYWVSAFNDMLRLELRSGKL